MNPDFESCLKKNKIRKFSPGKSLTGKEIATAESDIKEAKESLTSHYCLIIALKALYVETGELPVRLVEGLQRGKNLREDADYYNEWSKAGAEEMINTAYEFLEVARSNVA